MRDVRLPMLVPHLEVSARMSSAIDCSLSFRGAHVSAMRVSPSSVQAGTVLASSRPGAGCANRPHLTDHQLPRSRSSSGRGRCGRPSPILSSGSSVRPGGVCRCLRGQAAKSAHSHRGSPFEASQSTQQGLYCSAQSAYGWGNMRQPNYAFERTVMRGLLAPRALRDCAPASLALWRRATAQRER